jgi:hypothetical protein
MASQQNEMRTGSIAVHVADVTAETSLMPTKKNHCGNAMLGWMRVKRGTK